MANKAIKENVFLRMVHYVGDRLQSVGKKEFVDNTLNPPDKKTGTPPPPNGRQSLPPYQRNFQEIFTNLSKEYKVVTPAFQREVIPIIRKLVMVNPDFGQALQNIVFLGNTGHKIHFDHSLPQEQQDKMRDHLTNKHKEWASGQAGIDGMVNRMFSQLMIGGALSNEWVPNAKLTGIEANIMVNVEDIVFVLDKRRTIYMPYQRVYNGYEKMHGVISNIGQNLIPLNPTTYRYYALNGDGEIPYGFPPYMAALDAVGTQENMHKNINHVIDQLGLLGFLECLIALPEQLDDEADDVYSARLQNRLDAAKIQVDKGMANGSVVGYIDQTTFNYNSIAKDFDKAIELYKQNELQLFSGLKQDATLAGRDYNTSESQITVMFMKMLSELKNVQNVIKCNLEFGYALELTLAGFNFNNIVKVEFNKSTIQDDLKSQQALEYKIKNLISLYLLGILSTTKIAQELGYDKPDQDTPRVSDEILAGQKAAIDTNSDNGKTDGAKGSKNKSAKTTRDKSKPQGSKK